MAEVSNKQVAQLHSDLWADLKELLPYEGDDIADEDEPTTLQHAIVEHLRVLRFGDIAIECAKTLSRERWDGCDDGLYQVVGAVALLKTMAPWTPDEVVELATRPELSDPRMIGGKVAQDYRSWLREHDDQGLSKAELTAAGAHAISVALDPETKLWVGPTSDFDR